MLELPILQAHPECSACPLSTGGASSVGMPTAALAGNTGKDRAVLVLAGYPGIEEDKRGEALVGYSGKFGRGMLLGVKLQEVADVYLQNAVRCFPEQMNVTGKMLKACRQWLDADVQALAAQYQQVVLLCMGGEARKAVLGEGSSALGSFEQGQQLQVAGVPVTVFATVNPMVITPGMDPPKRSAALAHMRMLKTFCEHGTLPMRVKPYEGPLVGADVPDPPADVPLLSLDIETYGACDGFPRQNYFHPQKCVAFDGVTAESLIVCTGLAWRDASGGVRAKVYRHDRPDEVARLKRVLNQTTCPILGQNVQFDILCLRFCGFAELLNRRQRALYDLAVLNYLENDQRYERSLKRLAPLLGVTTYKDELSLKTGDRYAGPDDPRLWKYCALDCAATLVCYETLVDNIYERFPASPKWREPSRRWFSDLLWTCVTMSENGIEYDRPALERLLRKCKQQQQHALETALRVYQLKLGGTGSQEPLYKLFDKALQELAPTDGEARSEVFEKVEFTDGSAKKPSRVGVTLSNSELLLELAPRGHPLTGQLRLLRTYKHLGKIIGSYLEPMLGLKWLKRPVPEKPARGKRPARAAVPGVLDLSNALVGSRAYPTWYPCPMPASDKDDTTSGTCQARITSKGHAVQTEPPEVEECLTSRYGSAGAVVHGDGSQIELRTAAAESGAESMLAVYREGRNLHAESGSTFAGFTIDKKKHPDFYATGKECNFARMFGATASTLQRSVRKKAKLELPLPMFVEFLRRDRRVHPAFYRWQDSLVRLARRQGYLETPVTGHSRTFIGPLGKQRSAILNILIQAKAALLVQSAQMQLEEDIDDRGWRGRVFLLKNVADEIVYDMPRELAPEFASLLQERLRDPPLLAEFRRLGFAECPFDAEVKIHYGKAA